MYSKIKNVFFIVIFSAFVFLITNYYFSEENIITTNKSRSSYEFLLNNENNLPLLKNDTDNIIVYLSEVENFKKKRKKRFWEKLISNDKE